MAIAADICAIDNACDLLSQEAEKSLKLRKWKNRREKLEMNLYIKLLASLVLLLAVSDAGAQPDHGMMMGDWGHAVWWILGVLIFVALVLAILALLKYLFGRR